MLVHVSRNVSNGRSGVVLQRGLGANGHLNILGLIMKTVNFCNNGILDATAISAFGVNVKDNDSAIGYFGTGLKYAIAVVLREGCDITIQAGDTDYLFTTVKTAVRGKTFDVIHMNGVQLGFTTELGKNWEMWQAFRELYCNTLDEKGYVSTDVPSHQAHETTVRVDGEKFYQAYLERNSIVLETESFIDTERCSVHRGHSKFTYYKGVRIYDALKHSLFTYNIRMALDITEDRTAKYAHQLLWTISDTIRTSTDRKFITKCLLAERGLLESDIDLTDGFGEPSDVFLDVAEGLRLNLDVNRSIFAVLAKHNRLPTPKAATLTDVQQVMLERAIKFSKAIGYPVDFYPIVTSAELKSGFHGLAEDSTIYLSPDVFDMGTKYLASTLIEEYLHLHTGYGDMTRELQNHLFNAVVSLGERLLGEPV